MGDSTNEKDQHNPQIIRGGGTKPDPSQRADDRPPAPEPAGGGGVDLKTEALPEPDSD